MPCLRCGTRQSDPGRGRIPWRRAVRGGWLVCPGCQDDEYWRDAVEACPQCGSLDLARRLGQAVCTQCLAMVHETAAPTDDRAAIDDALSREVADAIERTLGRA